MRSAEAAGHSCLILDGTVIPIDRVAADRPFCSGKHRLRGMNVQVLASPGYAVVDCARSTSSRYGRSWKFDTAKATTAEGIVALAVSSTATRSYGSEPVLGVLSTRSVHRPVHHRPLCCALCHMAELFGVVSRPTLRTDECGCSTAVSSGTSGHGLRYRLCMCAARFRSKVGEGSMFRTLMVAVAVGVMAAAGTLAGEGAANAG